MSSEPALTRNWPLRETSCLPVPVFPQTPPTVLTTVALAYRPVKELSRWVKQDYKRHALLSLPVAMGAFVKVHLGIDWRENRQLSGQFEAEISPRGTFEEEYIGSSGGKHQFLLDVRPSEKDRDWLAERVEFELACPFRAGHVDFTARLCLF